MQFGLGLLLGGMVGGVVGAGVVTVFVAKTTDEIIADLYEALEEWVEYLEKSSVPDYLVERYFRSIKALNRAQGR